MTRAARILGASDGERYRADVYPSWVEQRAWDELNAPTQSAWERCAKLARSAKSWVPKEDDE